MICQWQELRLDEAGTRSRGTRTNDVKELEPVQEHWESSGCYKQGSNMVRFSFRKTAYGMKYELGVGGRK